MQLTRQDLQRLEKHTGQSWREFARWDGHAHVILRNVSTIAFFIHPRMVYVLYTNPSYWVPYLSRRLRHRIYENVGTTELPPPPGSLTTEISARTMPPNKATSCRILLHEPAGFIFGRYRIIKPTEDGN